MKKKRRKGGGCEISRLPEELLSAALSRSLATPQEAARAATVSRAFRAAADSDHVWSSFLPGDLPPLAAGELNHPAPSSRSNKEMFLRLSDHPVLLADSLTSLRLDKKTGAKCYMLSARALDIFWGDNPEYWRWIPHTDCSSRFSECAQLVRVSLLVIRARISCSMFPINTNYGAYIVFKTTDKSYGYANLNVGERPISTQRPVYLQPLPSASTAAQLNELINKHPRRFFPNRRADGWMELEIAGFRIEEGDVGDVRFELRQQRLKRMEDLTVQGIEIRPQVAGQEAWFSAPPTPGLI